MIIKKDKKELKKIRKNRANKIYGTENKPRVILNESNRFLTTQVINDEIGHTLIFLSTRFIFPKDENKEKVINIIQKSKIEQNPNIILLPVNNIFFILYI